MVDAGGVAAGVARHGRPVVTPATALILGGCAIIVASILAGLWLPGIVLGGVVVGIGLVSVVGS